MEDFCIMAVIKSNRSPGDERFSTSDITVDIPPVKSTKATFGFPQAMLAYPPFSLRNT